MLDEVRRYRRTEGWRGLTEFAGLLALDNQTHDVTALKRNADTIAELFAARGAAMEILRLGDDTAPLVTGRLGEDPGRPTIGVYVHYDGQPASPAGWQTPPFEPTLKATDGSTVPLPRAGDPIDDDWRLYARGSADDKAPLAALLMALDALHAAGAEKAVNLVFCFEGEEESGSPHLRNYLERYRDRLRADAWLICDGPVHHTGAPQVVLGVRGYCGVELTVYGPVHEIHSGHYGNWAPNPALRLAQILASCKGSDGRVTIDGFYDTTRPPSDVELEALANLPPVEQQLLGQLGLAEAEVPGSRLVDRLMWPSFNIKGLVAADVGSNARNVIPSTATASIDVRLAAGNDGKHMVGLVRAHLERLGHHVVDHEPTADERRRHPQLVRLSAEIGYPAMRTPLGEPIVGHLTAAATRAAGREALAMPTLGGSVPLHDVAEVLGAPTVVLPIANHDNNQHAANENLRLGNLWYGVDLWAELLTTAPPRATGQRG
jgi:acetylornithine deacetylase/succinyl-diaminopimelate desuccinylase-like protein